MSDFPERIRYWLNDPGNEVVISVPDQPYPTGSPEYVRKDIADAAGWQPIETAPKDCVIDLWSTQSGRYPDAIWDACCGVEGWTDANDHHGLEGSSFTHWRHRPAGHSKEDSHE
jgi:hypothetical protein